MPMALDTASAPGWYGKLSTLGDFASRRLEPDWIHACDEWLAHCMQASHAQLGPQWLDTYLSAPVWRFAWAPGVVDRRWWFGVLMPSCDNVGRYFPLVVVQPRDRPPTDRIGLDHLELWWNQAAGSALHTLQEHTSLDEFEAALSSLPPWPGVRGHAEVQRAAVDDRLKVTGSGHASALDLMAGWAGQDLLEKLAGCSIWWPMAQHGHTPALTAIQGLPEPQRFADLLQGHW